MMYKLILWPSGGQQEWAVTGTQHWHMTFYKFDKATLASSWLFTHTADTQQCFTNLDLCLWPAGKCKGMYSLSFISIPWMKYWSLQ